jgi:predicted AlkP superfamily phosphohydrolase/phosphomutase
MSGGRLAMIGLDAAELGLIRANLGRLPNLARTLAGGTLHTLRSTADLLTGSVWPTFYTGSHPGEHGIYHHLQWDAQAMRLRRVGVDWLDCSPFWSELDRRGRRVTAVDVPMMFEGRVEKGVEVLNWGSHDQLGPLSVRPRALEGEVRRRFGKHPMGWEIPVDKTRREHEEIRDNLVAGARRKGALVRWLLDSVPWDFFVAVFGETHRGGHILWPEGPGSDAIPANALVDVYRAVDESLGEILASPTLAGAGRIVFALHGMGPDPSQDHFVPQVMDLVNARFARPAIGGNGAAPPRPHSLIRRLREGVPAGIQNRIARAVPVGVRDAVVNRSIVAGHDWSGTPGFDLLADMNGYLRLNVRGREREGSLERDGETLPRYVDWVRQCFESFTIAGTGEPLVEAVRLAGKVFPGARVDRLPDLIVTWAGHQPVSRIESRLLGTIEAAHATGRSGNHRRDGFCVVDVPGREPPALTDARDLARFAQGVVA